MDKNEFVGLFRLRLGVQIWKVSSKDIEVIRTVFNFIFFHEKNSKHLKHKQKASN